jgi:hypothetical protein
VTRARADRRELLRMLDRLSPDYVLMVTRVDGLASNTFSTVRHRQAHRRCQRAQFRPLGETVSRHRHQRWVNAPSAPWLW